MTDLRSPEARAWRKLYKTKRYQTRRPIFLKDNPWCVYCLQLGIKSPSAVVHHKTPHKGDTKLFHDEKNWQPVCKECHDSHLQSKEKTGVLKGVDEWGVPLDPDHPWRKEYK